MNFKTSGVQLFYQKLLSRILITKVIVNRKTKIISTKVRAKPELWALDFDGVICDSVGESSLSAWKAAEKLWPSLMSSAKVINQKGDVIKNMRIIRPVVETGYENIIQIRCLLEDTKVTEIIDNWRGILEESLNKWNLNRAELVSLFGKTRDEWMAEDIQSWLSPNRIYQGIPEALRECMALNEVYIVTTKQERFTYSLLKDMAGVEFPMERIFSQTISGTPKTEVLLLLQERHPNMLMHFVEDKAATLEKVCLDNKLSDWNLYLADWGYNTEKERNMILSNSRVSIITLDDFNKFLKRKEFAVEINE